MNKFTKSSLAMALQVMAVVILFGYPGCSSGTKSGEISPVKTSMTKDTTNNLKANMGRSGIGYMTQMLLKQKEEK
ncbi:MAG TPA: hypothetical protein VK498_16325 [Ferruginibacter sp.]|nr:hypothetical protein [Ferruginibacter sp.]